jgi:hypothetical protein
MSCSRGPGAKGLVTSSGVGGSQSGMGFSSSRVGASATGGSRRGAAAAGAGLGGNRPQLLDALGRNVTPKPLVPLKPSAPASADGGADAAGAAKRPANLALSRASDVTHQSDYNDAMSAGGFSEDSEGGDNRSDDGSDEDSRDGHDMAPRSPGSPGPVVGSAQHHHAAAAAAAAAANRERLSEAEAEAIVTLFMRETETITLFARPATRVLQDSAEYKEVSEASRIPGSIRL